MTTFNISSFGEVGIIMSGNRQTSFIAFSPDGELVVHGGRHAVYVWQFEAADLLAELSHEWLGMSRDSVTCLTRSGEVVSA